MIAELQIIFATEIGRVLLALATVAPVAIALNVQLIRQLRADLKKAHDDLNAQRANVRETFGIIGDRLRVIHAGAAAQRQPVDEQNRSLH